MQLGVSITRGLMRFQKAVCLVERKEMESGAAGVLVIIAACHSDVYLLTRLLLSTPNWCCEGMREAWEAAS